ncbi:MAG: DNA primase [Reyranella sp.]|uniref:DNA primase n=1 Tax=Reyranella sp. TaxID=1929291 RepID=UPI0011F6CF5A|nr:DNA primase [Reyranella sp.]TAJ90300.1 MAG: DNA primase [Reyranella sp.]TBR28923.1 MAG: DNA primase [Reyranella sp.]
MAFPPGFLDELRARLSLSDIVGRKVSLKRRSGAEYAGLCPFHNEKSPSFTVNDKKGFYHCFGCGEHGDAVGFVMKTEGLSFPESVEKLAREVNLPVPRATPAERERADRAATLQQVVELAALWFQKQLRLPVGRQGLDYLRGRGLSDVVIDDFRLGFAPDSRDGVIAALKRENVPIEKIVEAGLAIQPEDGREPYDRFRGRVMFVINDRRGRAIAFGGRVMGVGEPKYLNSPETPLFHKGANLYCLDRARQAATKDQPVIVAEGYMDVIALHGAGFTGAVAPLGTALTEGQLAELWKLADEPYLCFDGDNAGRRAASRAAERALPLLRPGKSLRFLTLPAGEDPDSLVRTRGPEAVRRVLDLARPLSDVVWELEIEGKSTDTPERRASLQRSVEQRVAEIADPMVREYYRTEMRNRLNRMRRPEAPAWQPGGGGRKPFRRPGDPEPAPFAAGSAARRAGEGLDGSRQERVLLGALIERPALLHVLAEDLASLPIGHPELARLRSGLLDALSLVPSGVDPAADEAAGDPSLEAQLIAQHLERIGLGRLAAAAQAKAREAFRDDPADTDGWVGQWRRAARHLSHLQGGPEELKRAEEALAEDMSEENLQRLQAILDRMRRENIESNAI